MLDSKLLRNQTEEVAEKLAKRGFVFELDSYQELENHRKLLQQNTESLQAQRNCLAKEIGVAKQKKNDVQSKELTEQATQLSDQLVDQKNRLKLVQKTLFDFCARLPNIPDDRVPVGKSELHNQHCKSWGEIKEKPFTPRDHVAIGNQHGGLDFDSASQIVGSRFCVIRNNIALLHRALARFMLDLHVDKHGYQEIVVPALVNEQALFGTGQLPKFEQDLFRVIKGGEENNEPEKRFFLIPTAEVPLTNLVANQIIEADSLPLRFVAHSLCFRSEAGNSGQDVKGLIRQHQFEKVELVQICKGADSFAVLEEMTEHAETVLKLLELPFRRIALCTGDIGFSASFTYDLEVWIPSQKMYREISSISNCTDFQARRMQARWRDKQGGTPELLHTLNGSGVAVGRALVALLENHQTVEGHIFVPQALRPYVGNQDVLISV